MKPPNGKLLLRTFKTCTPLLGNTKLLKANSPQHLLRDQLLLSSKTHRMSPTPGELPPKLIKISEETSEVTSSTTQNKLPQLNKLSAKKLTVNGSHKLRELTNLTFKSLKKLVDSMQVFMIEKPLNSETTLLVNQMSFIDPHNSLTHMLTLWLLKTPP